MTFKDIDLSNLTKRMQTLDGAVVKVGLQEGSAHIDKGVYNNFGTSHIPARPFVSDFGEKHAGELKDGAEKVGRAVVVGKQQPRGPLNAFADQAAELMRADADSGPPPANAASTIRQKGFDKPLDETGAMIADISGKVEGA